MIWSEIDEKLYKNQSLKIIITTLIIQSNPSMVKYI